MFPVGKANTFLQIFKVGGGQLGSYNEQVIGEPKLVGAIRVHKRSLNTLEVEKFHTVWPETTHILETNDPLCHRLDETHCLSEVTSTIDPPSVIEKFMRVLTVQGNRNEGFKILVKETKGRGAV